MSDETLYAAVGRIEQALLERGFIVRGRLVKPNKLRLIGKLESGVSMQEWLPFLKHFRDHANGWTIDTSKQYFTMKDDAGRLGQQVFAWRFIIDAPSIEEAGQSIVQAIRSAPETRGFTENVARLPGQYGAGVRPMPLVRKRGEAPFSPRSSR